MDRELSAHRARAAVAMQAHAAGHRGAAGADARSPRWGRQDRRRSYEAELQKRHGTEYLNPEERRAKRARHLPPLQPTQPVLAPGTVGSTPSQAPSQSTVTRGTDPDWKAVALALLQKEAMGQSQLQPQQPQQAPMVHPVHHAEFLPQVHPSISSHQATPAVTPGGYGPGIMHPFGQHHHHHHLGCYCCQPHGPQPQPSLGPYHTMVDGAQWSGQYVGQGPHPAHHVHPPQAVGEWQRYQSYRQGPWAGNCLEGPSAHMIPSVCQQTEIRRGLPTLALCTPSYQQCIIPPIHVCCVGGKEGGPLKSTLPWMGQFWTGLLPVRDWTQQLFPQTLHMLTGPTGLCT